MFKYLLIVLLFIGSVPAGAADFYMGLRYNDGNDLTYGEEEYKVEGNYETILGIYEPAIGNGFKFQLNLFTKEVLISKKEKVRVNGGGISIAPKLITLYSIPFKPAFFLGFGVQSGSHIFPRDNSKRIETEQKNELYINPNVEFNYENFSIGVGYRISTIGEYFTYQVAYKVKGL